VVLNTKSEAKKDDDKDEVKGYEEEAELPV
jgi:hypothetical protein